MIFLLGQLEFIEGFIQFIEHFNGKMRSLLLITIFFNIIANICEYCIFIFFFKLKRILDK